MLELLKSLVFAVIMVPVVMAIILGAIYGLGEVFNVFRTLVTETRLKSSIDSPKTPGLSGRFALKIFPFSPILFNALRRFTSSAVRLKAGISLTLPLY